MHHYKLHITFLVQDIFSDLPLDIFGALLMSSGYIVF